MALDIRLKTDFFQNPKVVRLCKILGNDGVISLLKLWLFTRQTRPNGMLRGMNFSDVEIAAGWAGNPGQFSRTLMKLGFLDDACSILCIHGWEVHQSYAIQATSRVEKARKAASARWARDEDENAPSNAQSKIKHTLRKCLEHEEGAQIGGLETMEGSQIAGKYHTSLGVKNRLQCSAGAGLQEKCENAPNQTKPNQTKPKHRQRSIPLDAIVSEYHVCLPTLPKIRVLGPVLKKQIAARWTESPDRQNHSWWAAYFRLVQGCPFLLGENNRGWAASLHWLVGRENMEKVLNGNYTRGKARNIFSILQEMGQGGPETPQGQGGVPGQDQNAQEGQENDQEGGADHGNTESLF